MRPELVRKQLERLEALPIPKDGPSRIARAAELVRVIAKYAQDEEHLIEAIDSTVDNCEWYPLPAVLKAVLGQTGRASVGAIGPADNPTDFLPRGCKLCDFTGHAMVERGETQYAKECACLKRRIAEQKPDISEDARSRVLAFARGA